MQSLFVAEEKSGCDHRWWLVCLQGRVGNFCGVYRRFHIVGADNMHSLQNQCRFSCDGSKKALLRRRILPIRAQSPSNERLSGSAREQRESGCMKLCEVPDERIVLLEILP